MVMHLDTVKEASKEMNCKEGDNDESQYFKERRPEKDHSIVLNHPEKQNKNDLESRNILSTFAGISVNFEEYIRFFSDVEDVHKTILSQTMVGA
jgi:hypothetical protein